MTVRRLTSLVFVSAMSFAAAASDNPGSTAAAASSANGKTRMLLTDAPFPFDRVARVDLYVVSIAGSVSPHTSSANANFLTMATPHRRTAK